MYVVSENRINGVSGKRTPENPNPGDEVWFGHEYAVSEPIEIEVKISSQQWRDGSGACHQTSSENWLSIEAEGASISPTKSQLENIPTSLEPGAIPETWNWPANGFTGSVFAGKAISSKSGRSWTANVKIISYNPSLGRVEGEIEWPSLNSVHKIVGELTGSNFTFKEVDYIKKGSANPEL
ncbi:MAG: hypothetical protein IPJ13_13720 [Saprospiraceae bacterium]|nr:hypothetical protein [Saprospiraceae bacterium]